MRTLQILFTLMIILVHPSCGTYVGNPEEDDDSNPQVITKGDTIPGSQDPENSENFPDELILISLADAPIDDLSEVNVKIAEISLKSSDGEGWNTLELAVSEAINLLAYQDGNKIALAVSSTIATGDYSQIRVILDDADPITAKDLEGNSVTIRAPSASSSGILIKYDFTIASEEQTRLTLDFDLRQSLRKTGNSYQLQPVIRAANDSTVSSIIGSSTSKIICLYLSDSAGDGDDSCDNALGTAKVKGGAFVLPFVNPGNYYIRSFDSDGQFQDSEIFNVQEGETVNVDEL